MLSIHVVWFWFVSILLGCAIELGYCLMTWMLIDWLSLVFLFFCVVFPLVYALCVMWFCFFLGMRLSGSCFVAGCVLVCLFCGVMFSACARH